MKVGIITFWQSSDNYGQQLQCWALQQCVKNMQHEPVLIRYDFAMRVADCGALSIIKKSNLYKKAKRIFKDVKNILATPNGMKNLHRSFASFRRDNLIMSKRLYGDLRSLQKKFPKVDALVVGSDQVWAQMLSNKENEVFFLNFGPSEVKRIAYAPSFAVDRYPENLYETLSKNLSRLDYISCRELSGVQICKDQGFDAEHVLDPTLLIGKNYYDRLKRKNGKSGDYVFVYSLNIKSEEDIRFRELNSLIEKNKLCCKVVASSGYYPATEIFRGVEYFYPTIGEWLSLIECSKYVVTPSFHGIVFSILFNKPFVYIPLKGRFASGNSRVEDLLFSLKLDNRILRDDSLYEDVLNNPIDWNEVNLSLDSLRKQSVNFLRMALQ